MERYSEETTQRDARAESYAQDDNRRASLRVVVDGGGTGTSTVISGLVQLPGVEVTAVINSFDNDGSVMIMKHRPSATFATAWKLS
jgi:hypothetical protein